MTAMKKAIIDIGSNSVRLLLINGDRRSCQTEITRLSEGLHVSGLLSDTAIQRTTDAICEFSAIATQNGVSDILLFATEAVRSAKNGERFCDAVKKRTHFDVCVLSGDEEAYYGFVGATMDMPDEIATMLDVGGASAELARGSKGKAPTYTKSLPLGAVRLLEACGQSRALAEKMIAEAIVLYNLSPCKNLIGIGGTASTLASLHLQLEKFDERKTHGTVIKREALSKTVDLLYSLSVEERKKLQGLDAKRADVIANAALLVLRVMEMLHAEVFTVSEKGNMDGYLFIKG